MTTKPQARRKPTPKEMTESAQLALADAFGALRWYAQQAKEIARAWAIPDGADATLRAAKPIASDAGRRAQEALAQRKTDRP